MNNTNHKKENNTWYLNNDSPTVFVFVHGFLSNSKDCWSYKSVTPWKNVYWPDLVIKDHRLDMPSIFLGGYYTAPDANDYGIGECASQLFQAISRLDHTGRASPLDKENIVFICHSMGGIVVRSMLIKYQEYFQAKNVGLVLLASPSLGSSFANLTKYLAKIFDCFQVEQLLTNNPHLVELDDNFVELIRSNKIRNFAGIEGFENHSYLKLGWLKMSPKVVTKESAARYFEARNLRETDHISIAKPNNINHPSHELLVDFWLQNFNRIRTISNVSSSDDAHEIRQLTPHIVPMSVTPHINDILFDRYQPTSEKYYYYREFIDGEIVKICSVESLWISGISGCGKTCAIARFINISKQRSLYIPLASCVGLTVEKMFNEIYLQLNIFAKSSEKYIPTDKLGAIKAISKLLNDKFSQSPFILFIEEIPLEREADFTEFIETTMALLIDYMQNPNSQNVCFIFSSIKDPKNYLKDNQKKILERMKFLSLEEWGISDTTGLLKCLSEAFSIAFNDSDIKTITESANGSPRFVKKFLKNFIVRAGSDPKNIQQVIKETGQELLL